MHGAFLMFGEKLFSYNWIIHWLHAVAFTLLFLSYTPLTLLHPIRFCCRFRFANPIWCFTNLLLIRPAQRANSSSVFHFSGQTQFGMIRPFWEQGVGMG